MDKMKQLIAAMGFASVVFAPMAHAATGSIEVTVIDSGVTITSAGDINFGEIFPSTDAATTATLNCADDTVSVTSSGATPRVIDDASAECADVVVQSLNSAGVDFVMAVQVTEAPVNGGNTITPTLILYETGTYTGTPPLSDIGNTLLLTTPAANIAGNGTSTYTIGGSLEIPSGTPAGDYSGTYFVEARVSL